MKNVIFTSLSILLISCGSQQQKPLATQPIQASSGEMILLGKINKANLQVSAHTPWFNQAYKTITVNPQWAKNLKPHLNGLNIKVFMGTWCDDSQREIPHFFKLLQTLEFDQKLVEMYAMSEEKTTPENFEKGLEIYNVPTIIFFKNGSEINRFVEFPVNSLESDITKIIKKEPYIHSYE